MDSRQILISACRTVELAAQSVRINRDRITELAQELSAKEMTPPSWRKPVFPEADDETLVQFLGVGNAINYCFTNFKTHQKFDTEFPEGSASTVPGAFAMWACFKKALERGIPVLSARFLAEELDDNMYDLIFAPATTPLPMRESRIQNLRATGEALRRWYGGKFLHLFEKADFRVWRRDGLGIIQRLVRHFPSYAGDVARYPVYGPEIPFHKRAWLLPLMYEGRARDSQRKLPRLQDPERIGPVCDYDVPKALRAPGVLVYSTPLARLVDEGAPLHRGSIFEIEIRSQTGLAMDELEHTINKLRTAKGLVPITQVELDFVVWSLGRDAQGRHHYTKTTAY